MKKKAFIIGTIVTVSLFTVLVMTHKEEAEVKSQPQKVNSIQKQEPNQPVKENVVIEEPISSEQSVVNNPKVVDEAPVIVEKRMSDEEIIALFKSKAMFESPGISNGYGTLVTVYSQENNYWLRICMTKLFDNYSDKFKPSTIDSTLLKLNPMMDSFDRSNEYIQLCRQPELYL